MRLFFYVLKDYLKYVLGTIILTVFLFILFDFIQKTTTEFAEFHPSTQSILKLYLYQVPEQVMQGLPIAGLLASVITMILLSRTNEVTAMRAAGMSPWQIALPLAGGGLVLSVLSLALGELAVPKMSQTAAYIHEVVIRGDKDDQIASGGKWLRSGQSLVNFQDYDSMAQSLTKVQVVEVRANFRPVQATEAQTAVFLPDVKKWLLKNIRILHFKHNGTLDSVETVAGTQQIDLPIDPSKLKKDRRRPNELAFRELKDLIDRGERSGVDTLHYKVEMQGKIAYPFAAFVVSLIGLKFGYKSERATETAKGVLIAFFVGISYWFILSAGRALGLRGDVPPFFAAWLPNVVILVIIGFDAWVGRRA